MSKEDDLKRYHAAAHGVQTGIAVGMQFDKTIADPKHLRTGIYMSKSDIHALATLLIRKGVFTEERILQATCR